MGLMKAERFPDAVIVMCSSGTNAASGSELLDFEKKSSEQGHCYAAQVSRETVEASLPTAQLLGYSNIARVESAATITWSA